MFKETKLIFRGKSSESGPRNEARESAGMLDEGQAKDINETRDILGKQDDLRKKISSNDLLTDKDKQAWNRKLENAQSNLSASAIRQLQEDFNQQQGVIKGMVDTYTRKVMDNEEDAFTIDTKRNIRSAKDYVKWFAKEQSFIDGEKELAMKEIDPDIAKRIAQNKKLLTKLSKKEVLQMRRSERSDKLKELESVEANSARYKSMLQKDEKLFHDINLYIEAFEDLTPQEQEDWMRRYEEEIAKPRRALVETHDGLPKKFQSSNFLKMPSKKKKEYLEGVETKIDREYQADVKGIPSEVWSDELKRISVNYFMDLTSVSKKARWLEFLPEAVKKDKEFAKNYNNPKFKDIKEMPDYSKKEWSKLQFTEDKEKMLKSMEAEVALLDTFTSIMDKSVDDKVISEKTKDRYMDMYNDGNLSSRRMAVRSIMTALAPRRSLLKDFEKLSPETQKKFGDFYDRGHKARLEIYKKAKTHDTENNLEESKEEEITPEALEQNDVKQIVEKLQKQADASEQLGNLEKALGLHEAVIAMHPENEHSKNKIDQLNMELNALEAASDENVLEAVDNQLRGSSAQEELKHIRLAQQILEDQEEVVTRAHGNEDIAKQNAHLGENAFDRAVHEELVKQSDGEKVIDRQGRAKKTQKIDLGKIGTVSNDTTQIEKDLQNLSKQDNLDNVQLVDNDAGKDSTIDEAKRRLQKREEGLARKVSDDEAFSLDEQLAA